MVLYKYRGFSNLEFALDIFINKRLYAANFKTLNDPMEGHYIYSSSKYDSNTIRNIRGQKAEYNIVSLSETPTNMVMWSYYSEGHHGFVVGVEVDDTGVSTEPIQYVDTLHLDSSCVSRADHAIAKTILLKKLKLWEHEKEYRCLVRNTSFVKIRIKELIFGVHTLESNKNLLTEIAKKFCPDISIRTLQRELLETGNVDQYEDQA